MSTLECVWIGLAIAAGILFGLPVILVISGVLLKLIVGILAIIVAWVVMTKGKPLPYVNPNAQNSSDYHRKSKK